MFETLNNGTKFLVCRVKQGIFHLLTPAPTFLAPVHPPEGGGNDSVKEPQRLSFKAGGHRAIVGNRMKIKDAQFINRFERGRY